MSCAGRLPHPCGGLQWGRNAADDEQRPPLALPRDGPRKNHAVTPHLLCRTVATAVNAQARVDLAAELLGHTDPKISIGHYSRRNEMVNRPTAEMLERAFAKDT